MRRCGEKRAEGSRPAALAGLTERESAIAALVAKRLSNREIAEQLFLSEGSVKQYINQIYSKLLITGDVRTKRKRARRARRAEELRHSKDAARLFCIDIPKKLSNLWLIPTFFRSTVQWLYGGSFIFRRGGMPLYRKYISAVTPLPDYILRVDFVSGSRLLLDMKPYLDKLRFRPLADPAVWNSAMTNGIFVRFRQCGAEP